MDEKSVFQILKHIVSSFYCEKSNKTIESFKELTFEQIFSKIPEHIYWKNTKGIYMGCNLNQALDLNLAKCEDIIGKTDFDLSSKEAAEKSFAVDKKVFKGKTISTEEEVITKGKKRLVHSIKSPLFNHNNEIIGLLGISIDITKEKQAEIIKRDFLSNMEHDLRTPFSGIGGIADLLNSCYADKYPELKEFFAIMTKSCTQWQEIHNRIFDALDLGQELKIESFYLQDEMERIKDLMAASAKMKNIELDLEYPKRETTGPIESDVLKIKLILSSLVGNAINFTEKGNITLKLEQNKNDFILEVIDTGIGIPKDKLKYIFEKFTKLKRSNTYCDKFKGMGLGLYNAQKDAAKIQGSISVTSKVGKGSIFKLKLPIKMKKT